MAIRFSTCIGLYIPDHVNCYALSWIQFDIVPLSQLTLTLSSFLSLRFALASILVFRPCFYPRSILVFRPRSYPRSILVFRPRSYPRSISLCLALASSPLLPSLLALYYILASILCRVLCFALAPTVAFSLCLDLAFLVNLPVSGPRNLQGCRNRELFFGLAASSASRVRPDLRLA